MFSTNTHSEQLANLEVWHGSSAGSEDRNRTKNDSWKRNFPIKRLNRVCIANFDLAKEVSVRARLLAFGDYETHRWVPKQVGLRQFSLHLF